MRRRKSDGFTVVELMIIAAIIAILAVIVVPAVSGHRNRMGGPISKSSSNATAQSNIHRHVPGTHMQIEMISCNDNAPNDKMQVSCLAHVYHEQEGNRFEVRLLCDQTRDETTSYDPPITDHHESTGCIVNQPP